MRIFAKTFRRGGNTINIA